MKSIGPTNFYQPNNRIHKDARKLAPVMRGVRRAILTYGPQSGYLSGNT